MLVLPSASPATVAAAVAAAALSALALAVTATVRRNMRAAALLAPVPGPKGHFLIGLLPELARNQHRMLDYLVQTALVVCVCPCL